MLIWFGYQNSRNWRWVAPKPAPQPSNLHVQEQHAGTQIPPPPVLIQFQKVFDWLTRYLLHAIRLLTYTFHFSQHGGIQIHARTLPKEAVGCATLSVPSALLAIPPVDSCTSCIQAHTSWQSKASWIQSKTRCGFRHLCSNTITNKVWTSVGPTLPGVNWFEKKRQVGKRR